MYLELFGWALVDELVCVDLCAGADHSTWNIGLDGVQSVVQRESQCGQVRYCTCAQTHMFIVCLFDSAHLSALSRGK